MLGESAHELMIRKLDGLAALTTEERNAVAGLPIQISEFPAKADIVTMGETPSHCCLVVSGFLIRYKVADGGQRQIINLHVPGDVPDLHSLHLTVMDHYLASLTHAVVGLIPHGTIREMNARYPRLAGALWRVTLMDSALLRERVVSLGLRSATERLAHLLCETFVRLQAMDLTDGGTMFLPITQVEMADMLGLSTVHMNRTVQDLRGRGLLVTDRDAITLPEWKPLADLAGFDPLYLHLNPRDRPKPP